MRTYHHRHTHPRYNARQLTHANLSKAIHEEIPVEQKQPFRHWCSVDADLLCFLFSFRDPDFSLLSLSHSLILTQRLRDLVVTPCMAGEDLPPSIRNKRRKGNSLTSWVSRDAATSLVYPVERSLNVTALHLTRVSIHHILLLCSTDAPGATHHCYLLG